MDVITEVDSHSIMFEYPAQAREEAVVIGLELSLE